MATGITEFIDDLNDEQLEQAINDFLYEQELIDTFVLWLVSWKERNIAR